MKKTAINIHHTAMYANDDVSEQFDAVNTSHRVRWGGKTKSSLGFYGGYHYIVERNGTIQQFREDYEVGAHNNLGLKRIGAWVYSCNYYALGVTFAGNMSRQDLTTEQVKSGVELIKRLQKTHNIIDDNVLPHRHYKPTQCPGNNLPDPVWSYLQEQYDGVTIEDAPIVAWCKKYNIISTWSNPPTQAELKNGWTIYNGLKAYETGKLKFDL